MTQVTGPEDNLPVLLEQYKLFVEMMDRHSARRAQTSNFYLTVLAALLAAVPFADKVSVSPHFQTAVFAGVGVLGTALCIVWRVNLHSYRQLSSGKFRVIEEMEKRLPAQPYTREWEAVGRGKQLRKYIPMTRIENWVPYTFCALYLVTLVYSLTRFF